MNVSREDIEKAEAKVMNAPTLHLAQVAHDRLDFLRRQYEQQRCSCCGQSLSRSVASPEPRP